MSANDPDHNYYHSSTGHVPPTYDHVASQFRDHGGDGAHSATSSTPTRGFQRLPAHSFVPPARAAKKNPTAETSFESYTSNFTKNGFVGEPLAFGHSADPHDFYKPFQELFGRELAEGGRSSDIEVLGRHNEMAAPMQQRRPSPITTRHTGAKVPAVASRMNGRLNSRTSPPPGPDHVRAPAKSNPTLSNTARNRQTSLKDLVNKFNQNPDEIPPVPISGGPRSASATSSPASSHPNYANARTPSRARGFPSGSALSNSPPSQGQSRRPSKSQRHYENGGSPASGKLSTKSPRSQRSSAAISSNPTASQSLTNLALTPRTPPRIPLFGEVVNLPIRSPNLGHGISGYRRRRGSEGSMHSPNPMFPEDGSAEGFPESQSLSQARLRDLTDTQNGGVVGPGSIHAPATHRRTRSDFTGHSAATASASEPHSSTIAPSLELTSPTWSTSALRHDSQSRIPISTRRRSTTSESGNSGLSTRNNSVSGTAPNYAETSRNPDKNFDARKKPQSPRRKPISSPQKKSPRRGDSSPTLRHPSPLLKAYISSPMPKVSPPLRSSRPRQPVSTASTAASRARVAERFGHSANGVPDSSRDQRTKILPELGNVDLAARRQKIQQAFTQTVRENERKEKVELEQKRMSMAIGQEKIPRQRENEELVETHEEGLDNLDIEDLVDERDFSPEFEELAQETIRSGASQQHLTVETANLSKISNSYRHQADSPTLGMPGQFPEGAEGRDGTPAPSSDGEPISAVTAGTTDTDFDNEPQEDLPGLALNDSALLNRVMSNRRPSPSAASNAHSGKDEYSSSDRDDRESIQIMLSETPINEKANDSSGAVGIQYRNVASDVGQGARLSTSSWTPSAKGQQSLDREWDTPMERIDEQSQSGLEKSAHSSFCTTASDETPQPWSPATFTSPKTDRTTLDSDAYSTINRVLDHYHDPTMTGPGLSNGFNHQLLTQSPDLARAGGWDPKKVTRLFLQGMARGRIGPNNGVAKPVELQATTHLHEQSQKDVVPFDSEDGSSSWTEKIASAQTMHQDSENGASSTRPSLEVSSSNLDPQRASLNRPDDWMNTSPSIGDWIGLQADSPSDDKPKPPPKDWRSVKSDLPPSASLHASETPHLLVDDRPQLPEIRSTGLGLSINIESPHEGSSHPMQPSRPTNSSHVAPIPSEPTQSSSIPVPRSPPSPSVYSKHPPSSIHAQVLLGDVSNGPPTASSSESYQMLEVETPSLQTSTPAERSQERPSLERKSTSADALTMSTSTPEQKRLRKRQNIIKELVETEHSYGQDMRVIDDIYKGTCQLIIVSAEDVKILFGNSDQIVAFSSMFLDALKQAAKSVYAMPRSLRWAKNKRASAATSDSGNTDESSANGVELTDDEKDRKTFIGEAFGRHMLEMAKVYGDYLKNHDAANQKLAVLQKSPKVQIWLKECKAFANDLTSAWSLDSLLVKPVQRILKYPLILDQLLEVTSEDHPDYTAIAIATKQMKETSRAINEAKKRDDVVKQATNGRKRKDSDVRMGISKAFRRKTENLKQQVGLAEAIEDDRVYLSVSRRHGESYFRVQVVMRDVEMYTTDVHAFVNNFNNIVIAIEGYIDVAQTNYPEIESKWRKFRLSMREMIATALPDHVAAIRKNVIEPMTTLIKLHEGPGRLIQKRAKRLPDFVRYKAIKDRGDKLDKKTLEQGEQFQAINDTLIDELPKLFVLTSRLMEACLNNYVQLQLQWFIIWRRKLSQAIDEHNVPSKISDIIAAFSGDFQFEEARVLSLGICNGSMLADAVNLVNFLSPTTTLTGDENLSPMPSGTGSRDRSGSIRNDASPAVTPAVYRPGFTRHSGSYTFPSVSQTSTSGASQSPSSQRVRASSAASGPSHTTREMPGAYRSYSSSTVAQTPSIRPSTSVDQSNRNSPILPRLDVDTPGFNRLSQTSPTDAGLQPISTYPQSTTIKEQPSTSARYSGFFSSAMPMSDTPHEQSPIELPVPQSLNVIFLAASVYEFNIDRARKEAGYPYLTYVAGEIFDVIGEKGELWLAKNQDDSTNTVGWIWNKHFAKLAG